MTDDQPQDTKPTEQPGIDNNPVPQGVVGDGSSNNSASKYLFVVLVLVVIGVIGIYFDTKSNPKFTTNSSVAAASLSNLAPAEVSITSSGFSPAAVSVVKGQAVVWTNNDTGNHSVASDPFPNDNILPDLNSKQALTTSDSYSYVFSSPGTYTYHDTNNPNLKGTVIVN